MGGEARRNYGLSALLRVGGVEIIVITHNGQATDLGQFTSLGVDPTPKSTIVVKSMQHFRAAFEPIAREVLEVDTGALSTAISRNAPIGKSGGPYGRSILFKNQFKAGAGMTESFEESRPQTGKSAASADLVLRNGTIWCGQRRRYRTGVAVWQGRVLATGSDAKIGPLIGPSRA